MTTYIIVDENENPIGMFYVPDGSEDIVYIKKGASVAVLSGESVKLEELLDIVEEL